VVTLIDLGREKHEELPLIAAIKESNDRHRHWNFERLQLRLGQLRGKTIAILGLTYKPGTDTLRRSAAVELCRELLKAGAIVRAVDPAIRSTPEGLDISLFRDPVEALTDADAVVICTEWPEFRQLAWPEAAKGMRGRLVLDANGFLQKELKGLAGLDHVCVGT
jgi:UDPglucose 6-dehydrogenase